MGLGGLLLAAQAAAFEMPEDEGAAAFITSNVVATFYHELGHGLIDVLELPVLGREEDAADTLSTLLIHDIWLEESAVSMVYDTAYAFQLYAEEAETLGFETPYWDEHSLDLQRYYNLVCLFYGANPDEREDIAVDLELPENRGERCPDEFDLAEASWGGMLEGLEPGEGARGLRLVDSDPDEALGIILADEIATLNQNYGLPEWIDVVVEECGQANAFYQPDIRRIIICTEYAEDLHRLWMAQE